MKEKEQFIHFIEKWFIIFIVLFIIIQLTALTVIDMFIPKDQKIRNEEYSEEYMGHWYNGTFFIEMTASNNYESIEDYKQEKKDYNNNIISKICMVSGTTSAFIGIILLFVAAYRERKKKLLSGHTPDIIIISGILILLYKIFEEIDLFIDTIYIRKYTKGFLKTVNYYPQMHYIFIIPILLMLLGLIFRQFQRKKLKLSTINNEKFIKLICILVLIVGLSFTVSRLLIRVFELLFVNRINIKLPFYHYMFNLPRSLASTESAYIKLVVLRFIKDLPIFISSFISIILFVNIVLSSIKGKIISKDNNKRYKIIFILLIISSLIFNILGLVEVSILNESFLYPYSEATYTVAIRSLSEPLLYAFFIYLFKYYIESNIKQ